MFIGGFMIYLLVGNIDLINKNINDIKTNNNISNTSINRYDLEVSSINDAITDINTISMFQDRKMVIVDNIEKLDDEESLIKYIDNKNDNILILISYDKLDERKKITKELKTKTKVLECFNIDLTEYIKNSLKDYDISLTNIMLFANYCNNDYLKITNEIEKLKLYKFDSKKIDDEDIKLLVKKSLDKNIFDLIKELNNKNFNNAYDIYKELKNNNEDDNKILSIIAKEYREILHIKILSIDNSDKEIMKLRNIKSSYRLQKLKEESYNYSLKDLENIIVKLSNFDIDIKSGVKNINNGLEMLFYDLCK